MAKNIADIIVDSYLNDEYKEFDEISKDYFSDFELNWRIRIYSKKMYLLYDSYAYAATTTTYGPVLIQSEVKLPVLNKDSELLTVILQLREKINENEE